MKKFFRLGTLLLAMAVLICSMSACGKKKGETKTTPAPSQQTADTNKTAEDDKKGEDKKEDSPYDTYKGTIVGVTFDFPKELAVDEATTKQMGLVQRLTEAGVIAEGKVFDVQRMIADENTPIVTLSGRDEANTTAVIAIAPNAKAEDVLNKEQGKPIEEQEVRATNIDDTFINLMKESIITASQKEGRTVLGDIIATPSPADSPVAYLTLEYNYATSPEAEKADYSVVHTVVPCGKNFINIAVFSQNKESKFDKITIAETIAKSLKVGPEYVSSGASEVAVIDDTAKPEDNKPTE